jgi:sphinganine-1-phosphate aldolase
MLPWLEKLGKKIPLWDFRVPGVTSISADIHKYGYSSKGASVILYKNASLRAYQYFAYAEWPGGLFGSPSLAGSRPGGMIASAWAALVGMGQSGYLKMAKSVLETTEKLCAGVEATEGIRLQVQPDMTALSIAASDDDMAVNVLAVADVMEEQSGWKMERQQLPDTLHLSVLPQHARTADQFVIDLKNAVAYVRAHPETANQGTTGVYGMVAKVPDKGIITEFISKFFGSLYTLDKGKSVLEEYGDLVVAESKN